MKRHILFAVIIAFIISNAASAAIAFDRNASGTTTGNVTFGITGPSSTHQTTLAITSKKTGNGIFTAENQQIITVDRLTVYGIIPETNTTPYSITFFQPLPGSGILNAFSAACISSVHSIYTNSTVQTGCVTTKISKADDDYAPFLRAGYTSILPVTIHSIAA